MKPFFMFTLVISLTACSNEEQVFKECNFELTKVMAIKSGSLDKNDAWNRIMKRQFFMDCFEAKGYKLPNDMMLNRIN